MDKLEQAVTAILDTLIGYDRQPDGTFTYEIYADYRDEMDNKTAIQILQSKDPMRVLLRPGRAAGMRFLPRP